MSVREELVVRGLVLRRVEVPLSSLPPGLDGLTICQISDLHWSRRKPPVHVRRGIELAASLKADLIVVTGDFVHNSAPAAKPCGEALSVLSSPLGVYGVRGNHDYWSNDIGAVVAGLEAGGVQMLTNRAVPLTHNGCEFWLAGVDDNWDGGADLDATLASVPSGAFVVLLSHMPDFADRAAARGIPLQLSGHSHGGQIILPIRGPAWLPPHGRKYPAGLRRVGDTWVYTNAGLGAVFPPIRFRCPAEVTLLILRRDIV